MPGAACVHYTALSILRCLYPRRRQGAAVATRTTFNKNNTTTLSVTTTTTTTTTATDSDCEHRVRLGSIYVCMHGNEGISGAWGMAFPPPVEAMRRLRLGR